jgi:hypothetical protein
MSSQTTSMTVTMLKPMQSPMRPPMVEKKLIHVWLGKAWRQFCETVSAEIYG